MSDFAGKTAIVTGGASGIGFALCRELSARGATVYAADRNIDGLATLRQACTANTVRTQALDVSQESEVAALLDRVMAEQGRIDYLFNNAGIVVGGDFEAMDSATWRKIVDINLWGVIYGSQYGYKLMLEQGGGHIINTASTAGVMPVAKSAAYAATKHAVTGLSTTLREEGRRHGIRVSVVVPGVVDTNIFTTATNLKNHNYSTDMDQVPFRKVSPAQAARAILHGVARNQQYIVFPFYNKVIVALNRLFPVLMARLINAS